MKPCSHNCAPALVLMWALPLLLLVPNVALDITESYSAAQKACNILLPAAAWLALSASFRRAGLAALMAVPVMVLCAFQIVLLFLYGQSIIAVDMFLNVVTTNVSEATELLGNLNGAIATVLALYLPPIAAGGWLIAKKATLGGRPRRAALTVAAVLALAGAVCALTARPWAPCRTLFPLNVCCNIAEAVHRTSLTKEFPTTSKDFSFGARSSRPDSDSLPPVYVLVIGETARADNWQLNGYGRPTNPRLGKREGVVSFTKVLSESNTTHKSVPLLLTHLSGSEFNDSIYSVKSIISAFSETDFFTVWLSNQHRNGALIDFFGSEADEHIFLADDGQEHFDMELCPLLADAMARHKDRKMLVVLHTYGSHFNYKSRYPQDFECFTPDNSAEASADNRQGLINAYDNTVAYTDAVIDSIIATIDTPGRRAAMLYVADHGEDIFDDPRGRFLHASPTPTYWQLHVPMLLWMSPAYMASNPQAINSAKANSDRDISSSRSVFHTMMDLAGVEAPCVDRSASVCSPEYKPAQRRFLDDYNEAVDLRHAGMSARDFAELSARKISAE